MPPRHSVELPKTDSRYVGRVYPSTRTELRAGETIVVCYETDDAFYFSALLSLERYCPYCRNRVKLNQVFSSLL